MQLRLLKDGLLRVSSPVASGLFVQGTRGYYNLRYLPRPYWASTPWEAFVPSSRRSFREWVYQKQKDVEDLEVYQPGGYHPVHVGDSYSDGRYRILHKLGWGSYSTVWLARDTQTCQYVALKVLVANVSEDSAESRVLRHSSRKDDATGFVASLLDEFYIDGPNGRHLCIATKPTRCSLGESKSNPPWMFPLQVSRAIAAQVIMGLQEMHERGVIHGELHPRNTLFTLPPIDSMSVEEIYQKFDPPQETRIYRVDGAPLGPGAPSYSVVPVWLGTCCQDVSDPRICIADFGESWLNTENLPREDLHTPVLYLPPETTFAKDSIGFPADVWTLACSIHEIMGERSLFEGFFADRDHFISEMISTLGPLPQDWWQMWEARGEFFSEDGSWRTVMKRCQTPSSMPLCERIQLMGRKSDPEFSAEEAESLERMLRAMFAYKPEKRATAKDVANSDWMKRWGIPSLRTYNIRVPREPS